MSKFPCKNPSCKSYGQPHPNCQCYGGMAEGGDVAPFCSEKRKHEPGCQYYAAGGSVHDNKALDQISMPQMPAGHNVLGALASMGAANLLTKIHDGESFLRESRKGHSKIKAAIASIFGKDQSDSESPHDSEKIAKYMEKDPVTKTMQLAFEGEHPLAVTHPTENTLMSVAKGRIVQHLNGLRPLTDAPKLALDAPPDNTLQEKKYKQVMGIAENPLAVLSHIKNGSLDSDHIKHLQAMYPELAQHFQEKITKHIIDAQMSEERPSWKVRQGLSLFMGTPLSKEFTPQSIQTAQSVFAQQPEAQPAQPGQATKKKKSTAPLTNSDKSYLTNDQARQQRQQTNA